ncbi:MAG: hypothetical protein A3F41_05270 [Coxiella sp. RIFCSPHIGHO2_12_FULL_44_14]|nr:MAG: hypothetical protein A3F41_05270 [Coxiella sp. RIFCSPHIGHO2_12_FULL_44_14]
MKKTLLYLLCIPIISFSSVVSALPPDDDPPPDLNLNPWPNVYITANLGYGRVNQRIAPPRTLKNSGFTLNTAAGIQVFRFISAEGVFVDFPEVKGTAGFHATGAGAGLKFNYQPLGTEFSTYIRSGFLSTSRGTTVSTYAGAGVIYYFNNYVGIGVEGFNVFGRLMLPNTLTITGNLVGRFPF